MDYKLKASDLRTGNLLQGEPFNHPRMGITSNGITKITAWGISNIEQGIDPKLKPIPLTEEWLDNMVGFQRLPDDKNRFKNTPFYSFPNAEDTHSITIELERNFVYCGQIIISRCEFVHQLQNLHYLMYKKELEFKEGTKFKPEHGMAIGQAKGGTLLQDEAEARKPSLEKCLEGIRVICEGTNFSEEELMHRARLLYLTHRLSFLDELPVMLDLVMYERKLERDKK